MTACPSGFYGSFHGSCYKVLTVDKQQSEQADDCAALGGAYLVELDDAEEFNHVRALFEEKGEVFFINVD